MSDSASRPVADQEWEELLRQLRTQPPARPRPFFYARVSARRAAPVPARPALARLLRPAYAVLLGAVVLTLTGDGRSLRSPAPPAARGSTPLPR